jgi:hypothetical protein
MELEMCAEFFPKIFGKIGHLIPRADFFLIEPLKNLPCGEWLLASRDKPIAELVFS